jgi:TolB-like protein
MGEQSVKNIARPVRVYALRPSGIAGAPAASVTSTATAPRLSIVVLPFANLSNDPEQQYFADGITEDLTTDLSRLAGMLVISRNTAFTYRNRSVDTKQISRELGVRYVLEGSVRRLGNQIRINAQLIDAESDAHLWAERFNGDTSDLFALQDEITDPDRSRAQPRADRRRGCPAGRASGRIGLYSPGTRHAVEAANARDPYGAD